MLRASVGGRLSAGPRHAADMNGHRGRLVEHRVIGVPQPATKLLILNLWVSPSGGSSPLRCVTACAFNASNAFGSIDAAYAAASPGDTVVLACGSYGYTNFSSRKSSGPNVVFEPASAGCVTTEGFQFENGGDYATLRGLTINDSGGAITQSGSSFSYGVVIDGDMINVGQRVDTQDVNLHLVNGWQIVNSTIGPSCCGAGGNSPEGIRIGTPGGGNSTNVLIDNNLIQYTLRTTATGRRGGRRLRVRPAVPAMTTAFTCGA